MGEENEGERRKEKAQKAEKGRQRRRKKHRKTLKREKKRRHITTKQRSGFAVRKQQNSLHITLFICKFAKERTLITEKIKKMTYSEIKQPDN